MAKSESTSVSPKQLVVRIDAGCHGIYQNGRLIIIDNCTPREGDIITENLHWLFDKFGFKLYI